MLLSLILMMLLVSWAFAFARVWFAVYVVVVCWHVDLSFTVYYVVFCVDISCVVVYAVDGDVYFT